jgi:cytochrome d ubiquinol oxidase subunit II
MGQLLEANHVWLILAVVILFIGFPKAYAVMSVSFHIPLTVMLIGVVLRGCAFTFRSYDAVRDESQKYYSALFVVSSFLTPFMLGTVAGAMVLGRVTDASVDFAASYVAPWCNLFSLSVGAFTCVLFAFLAAVYLLGETTDPEVRGIFFARARALNVLAVLAGLWMFVSAEISGLGLVGVFVSHAPSLLAMSGATVLLVPLWWSIRKGFAQWPRILVASQVALILAGWFWLNFPTLVAFRDHEPVTLYNSAAPIATLRPLVGALLVGLGLVVPTFVYLLRVFKSSQNRN